MFIDISSEKTSSYKKLKNNVLTSTVIRGMQQNEVKIDKTVVREAALQTEYLGRKL